MELVPTPTFKGKTVLITGAGRGIGKRLALGFAAAGARVGLLSRSLAELELARLEIQHSGSDALTLCADVRNYRQLYAAMRELEKRFGTADVLVAAAAVHGAIGPFAACDPSRWLEALEVNIAGVANACRAVLPGMLARRSGKIIVLAGGGTSHPRPNFSAYAASKAAVARLVETLAVELRDYNVQINCMSPGGTYTHMTDEILQAGRKAGDKEIEQAYQVRLTGGIQPDRQIQLALFLASQRSNHISGKIIHINDDWSRLEHANIHPEIYTLRRVQKVNG
jgi:3-oxoacyl-[acyl-carrier protein] reductase